MIRERSVELEVERHQVDPEGIPDRAVDDRHAVRGIDDHLEAPGRLGTGGPAQEREHMSGVVGRDVGGRDRPGPGRSRQVVVLDAGLEQRDAVIAGDRPCLVLAELEPVVLRRVVRRRDLCAARCLQVADREVVHRRGGETDVDDIEACRGEPFDEGLGQRHRRRPHVARHHDAVGAREIDLVENIAERLPDLAGGGFIELRRIDAADVVRLENACHGKPSRKWGVADAPRLSAPTRSRWRGASRELQSAGCGWEAAAARADSRKLRARTASGLASPSSETTPA